MEEEDSKRSRKLKPVLLNAQSAPHVHARKSTFSSVVTSFQNGVIAGDVQKIPSVGKTEQRWKKEACYRI